MKSINNKIVIFGILLILIGFFLSVLLLNIAKACYEYRIEYEDNYITNSNSNENVVIDTEVIILKNEFRHWYASGHHYTAYVEVYNAEFGITKSFDFIGFDAIKFENIKVGDTYPACVHKYKIYVTDSDYTYNLTLQ